MKEEHASVDAPGEEPVHRRSGLGPAGRRCLTLLTERRPVCPQPPPAALHRRAEGHGGGRVALGGPRMSSAARCLVQQRRWAPAGLRSRGDRRESPAARRRQVSPPAGDHGARRSRGPADAPSRARCLGSVRAAGPVSAGAPPDGRHPLSDRRGRASRRLGFPGQPRAGRMSWTAMPTDSPVQRWSAVTAGASRRRAKARQARSPRERPWPDTCG